MTIACGLCGKTVSPERAGKHSLTCKVAVSARVAEDRKARPAQYLPIPAPAPVIPTPDEVEPGAEWFPEPEPLSDSAPTQGMLFGEDWTR